MNEEIWVPFPDYENLYEVSTHGNVKSLNYRNHGTSHLLSPGLNGKKYKVVNLYKNSVIKMHIIHRMVAITFIPNPINLPQVNHKDEDKNNNRVSNLEWCTNEYNFNYGTGKQRRSNSCKRRILGIHRKTGERIEFNSGIDAKIAGFDNGHISSCCHGNLPYHKGYYWKLI